MSENKEAKKNILDKGKILSNGSKVISIIIAVSANIIYLIFNKKIMSVDEQQSLLYVCLFVVGVFAPVDLSMIFSNIFTKNGKQM